MKHKKVLMVLFIICYPLWGELVACASLSLDITLPKILFAFCFGGFLLLLGNISEGRRRSFWVQTLGCFLVTALQFSQIVYWKIFNTPYYIKSASGLADAMEFWQIALAKIQQNIGYLVLLLLPLLCFLTIYHKWFCAMPQRLPRRPIALSSILLLLFGITVTLSQRGGVGSPRDLLLGTHIPVACVRTFGILPNLLIDVKNNILGIEIPDAFSQDISFEELNVEEIEEQPPEPEPVKTPEDYPENVMDITFDLEETNATLRDMNEYFSSRTPTRQNEYTGMFEGKNLILITAEGFSKFIIDEERTPTLYKLSQEGFQFENFYTPIWGVSTSDGEYVATTGLVPKYGVWSYTQIANNYMPFALGNQFSAQGAKTYAFHNHSYTYYNRYQSYPNMGYTYYGLGNGLQVTQQWPESDVELIEASVPYYNEEEQFHIYYLTVSGHLEYNFGGNKMAANHQDEVADLPYSTSVQAYLACQMELEYALEELLEQLEASGQLENTVIALSGDHYPYGLTLDEYAELRGQDSLETTFELYENTFLLWTPDLEEPVKVKTPCSSLDILPTLSNLFGLEYDSRLMMGTDIFSGTPPMVLFYDHSFINDKVMYDASHKRVIQKGSVTQEQLNEYITDMTNRFTYAAKIIDMDYYGYLFQQ